MLKAIVAHDSYRGIGIHGQIPWKIPADLKWFRSHTMDQYIVVGRKTFDLLPLLPGRCIYILGKDHCTVEQILDLNDRGYDFWIVGGQACYESFMPYIDEVYATEILGAYICDKVFPQLPDRFKLVQHTKILQDNGNYYQHKVYYG